ncbi:hypothetical protein [Nostoc sp. 'Peltigera membranacea cyanobiont' 210A]|uniref:hypothetical protein n=1 Tax=Nostoc sp. 'Peltigera membranacea cyanobiont' 210A TaxID=2014529 RepID=UPI00118064DF|nr:hypothetical protein [Nostoc sp. 'Peltigera membranacea cyanobiont' 210A]
MHLALAIRNRGYTNKVRLRGLMQNQGFQPALVVTERLVSGVEPCRTPPGKQATRSVCLRHAARTLRSAGFACVAVTSSARVQNVM